MTLRKFLTLVVCLPALFSACQDTESQGMQQSRAAMAAAIKAEKPGNYYIGRRYFKLDYKFWGWVRRPGEPWSSAKMIMMNEQAKLAPDREQGHIGSDNGYEYKLFGEFTGDTVYEPASNGFYPEFKLKNYQLLSVSPGNIYPNPGAALDPARREIVHPR